MPHGAGKPALFHFKGNVMAYAGYFVMIGFLGALWLALDG